MAAAISPESNAALSKVEAVRAAGWARQFAVLLNRELTMRQRLPIYTKAIIG